MANLFSSGPALFYVAIPEAKAVQGASVTGDKILTESRTIRFLGTAEAKPIIEERRGMKPVFNDLGGEEVPFDVLSTNKELWIGATLNRFNYGVYGLLADVPYRNPGGPNPGTKILGSVGTLLLQEGQNIWVIVSFPYASKYPGYVAGYFARGGVFLGPDKHTIGTNVHTVQVVFQCLPIWRPTTANFHTYTNLLPVLPQAD